VSAGVVFIILLHWLANSTSIGSLIPNQSTDNSELFGLGIGISILFIIALLARQWSASISVKVKQDAYNAIAGGVEAACKNNPKVICSLKLPPSPYRPGLTLGYDVDSGREIFLSDDLLTRHGLVLGTTGVGKSEFLLTLCWQQMLRGGTIIFVDAKRREPVIRKFVWMCKQSNRLRDLRLLDFGDRYHSHRYNLLAPLAGESPSSLVTRVTNIMPPIDSVSDASHYREGINEKLAELFDFIMETGRAFTLKDIHAFLKEPMVALDIIAEDLRAKGKSRVIERLYRFRRDFANRVQEQKFQDLMSTLTSSLRGVLDPKISDILCGSTTGEVSLDAVALKGQILYMALPKLSNPEVTQHFLRSFQAHLQQVVGHLSETNRSNEVGPPALIILDEFGSYALPGFAGVAEMGRSAHVSVWYSIQTRAKLADRALGLSESFASNIMNNCRTLVSFTILDPDDADLVSRRWGDKATADFTLSTTAGESIGTDGLMKIGITGRQTDSQNLNEGFREGRAQVVPPSVLTTGLQGVDEGKGRALIDPGTGQPQIMKTGWIQTAIPPDFNPAQEQPQLRPMPSNPLALAERIAASIIRSRQADRLKAPGGEPGQGRLVRRPRKAGQAAPPPAESAQEPPLPAASQVAAPLDADQPAPLDEPPAKLAPAGRPKSNVWVVQRPRRAKASSPAPAKGPQGKDTPPATAPPPGLPQEAAPSHAGPAPSAPPATAPDNAENSDLNKHSPSDAPPSTEDQNKGKLPPPPWAGDNADGLGAIRWLVKGGK
jgi:hypothetical protein